MSVPPVLGTWQLVAYELEEERPERRRPLGTDPLGQLIYTRDGYMSVNYMAGGRPALHSASWALASDIEKLDAARSYGSYSGRYEWLGDRVAHHVEASLYPNWIGNTLVRLVAFDGQDMVFRAAAREPRSKRPTPVLRWRRRR